jgi:hypothetical protein
MTTWIGSSKVFIITPSTVFFVREVIYFFFFACDSANSRGIGKVGEKKRQNKDESEWRI